MYRLQQQSDMDFVPCHIRNLQRQEELYDFLVDGKEGLLQYSPVLIADNRLTLESIQKLDYLESFLPAPIFSERAKMRIEKIVGEDVVFYPCKINLKGELLQFYLAKIFRKLPILDVENSPFYTLSDGKKNPTYPYKFTSQDLEYTLARDCYYPSLFVVSSRLQKEMYGLYLELVPLI